MKNILHELDYLLQSEYQISSKYETKDRIGGTLSSIIFSFSQGIKIFRVHDVQEIKQGLLVFETLLNK